MLSLFFQEEQNTLCVQRNRDSFKREFVINFYMNTRDLETLDIL